MTRPALPADGRLRTADVVRESGYSAQQVRDLERLGVVPPAAREANGYRSYTAVHVRALRAYRGLASAAGPVEARRLLAEVLAGAATGPPAPPREPTSDPAPGRRDAARDPAAAPTPGPPGSPNLADAAAAIGAVHVRLARERDDVLRALTALDAIRGEPVVDVPGDEDVMTITQLAAALGVRTSTLRFWEQEGLAVPERVTSLRARQYGPAAVREARIVAALRASGYGVPAVRDVVASVREHEGVAETRRILDRRLDQIAGRTIALLRAGADIAAVIAPD